MSVNTKNVLLDVTGLDYTKCNIVLDTLCAMFSQHCAEPFTVEQVEMIVEDDFPNAERGKTQFVTAGQRRMYPTMKNQDFEADLDNMKASLDLAELDTPQLQEYLNKMMLPSKVSASDPKKLVISRPCTRSDIMHEVDIVEDLAIAYGYNNLKAVLPQLSTEIKDEKINRLTDMLRQECAGAGFNECLNFALCSYEDCFNWFRREPSQALLEANVDRDSFELNLPPVKLSNPKAKEYNMVRTSLIQGLLKTLNYNRKNPLPIRLFEVSDVVVQDKREETGARNQRRVAALLAARESNFEVIHGLLDHLMYKLNCRSEVEIDQENKRNAGLEGYKPWSGTTYKIESGNGPEYIEGLCGNIYVDGVKLGSCGVLRPDVLNPPSFATEIDGKKTVVQCTWQIQCPVSIVEFNIEPFLRHLEKL